MKSKLHPSQRAWLRCRFRRPSRVKSRANCCIQARGLGYVAGAGACPSASHMDRVASKPEGLATLQVPGRCLWPRAHRWLHPSQRAWLRCRWIWVVGFLLGIMLHPSQRAWLRCRDEWREVYRAQAPVASKPEGLATLQGYVRKYASKATQVASKPEGLATLQDRTQPQKHEPAKVASKPEGLATLQGGGSY